MSRWSLKTLTPLIMLAGAACATGTQSPQPSFTQSAPAVFFAGYRQINARYIRAVPMRVVAVNAIKGLRALDPRLTIRFDADGVFLNTGGKAVQVRNPVENSAAGWAMTSLAVVKQAKIVSAKIRAAKAEVIYAAMFGNALRKLDRFSRYVTADDTRDRRAVRDGYGGIGVTIQARNGVTKVVSVMPATPAAKAGLQDDDSIVAIDGNPISGLALRAIVRRLRGPSGSAVRLTIIRANQPKPLNVSVKRRRIVPNLVAYSRDGNIAIIRVYRFNNSVARNIARAIVRAQSEIGSKLRGYVLDLRGNPGGLLGQSVQVADLFVPSGTIVSTRGRHPDSFQEYFSRSGDLARGKPVVVLVNGRSASASEIVAAALQDNGRAVVVGSTTFGKGTVQMVIPLPNEGELILTWSRFHAPSGYSLHHLGVMPNICTSLHSTGSAAQAIGNWQRTYARNSTLLRTWRRHLAPGQANEGRLRAYCPPTTRAGDQNIDIKVAKILLQQPALYQRAVRQNAPNYANRSALAPTRYTPALDSDR